MKLLVPIFAASMNEVVIVALHVRVVYFLSYWQTPYKETQEFSGFYLDQLGDSVVSVLIQVLIHSSCVI